MILNYTWSGRERSIHYHQPLDVESPSDSLPIGSNILYSYLDKKFTVTFRLTPTTPSMYGSDFAPGDIPVKTAFSLYPNMDFRSSAFDCSADISTVSISPLGSSRFSFDRYSIIGSTTSSGFTVTCIADVNSNAIPPRYFKNTMGVGLMVQSAGLVGGASIGGIFDGMLGISLGYGDLQNSVGFNADLPQPLDAESSSISITVNAPEITSQASFDNVITTVLTLLNSKLSGTTVTKADLRFSTRNFITWSSTVVGFSTNTEDEGVTQGLYKRGSKLSFAIRRTHPALASLEQGVAENFSKQINGRYFSSDRTIFVSVTPGTSVNYLTSVDIRFFAGTGSSSSMNQFTIQQDGSSDAGLISTFGVVPMGGDCTLTTQCMNTDASSAISAAQSTFCVEKKCTAYTDLGPEDRMTVMTMVGDATVSALGVGPYSMGLLEGSAMNHSIFLAFIMVGIAIFVGTF